MSGSGDREARGMSGSGGTASPRPVGRRPGDPEETKATILAAARRLFGEVGFERATIRAIAEAAEVDPALVIHHFTNKKKLFVAAHELPLDPSEVFAGLADIAPEERGRHLARVYVSMMATSDSSALSLLRAAATNEDAARMLREFVTDAILSHASWLAPGPDGERRLALAGAQLIGLVFAGQLVRIEAIGSATLDELVDAVGPVIQRYLDGTSATM
jgi:AcrR family transcriptional regulator